MMRKRFVFGLWLSFLGFLGTMLCVVCTVIRPCTYNGIGGLLGSVLGNDLAGTFLVSLLALALGLILAGWTAWRDGKR